MTVILLSLVGGLILLIVSAERFIYGASTLARNLRVSPLLIGVIIVGFGTSAPEWLVTVFAQIGDAPSMALTNRAREGIRS